MDSKSSPKVHGESIDVDPQLLFQRLLTAARSSTKDIAAVFKFELSSRPPSLLDTSGLLREANKPALAEVIWCTGKGSDAPPRVSQGMQCVLDGGSLLHHIPWPRGYTFDTIILSDVCGVRLQIIPPTHCCI